MKSRTISMFTVWALIFVVHIFARDLTVLHSKLSEEDSKRMLQVEVKNMGYTSLTPVVWADLYDDANRYVGRFRSKRMRIEPDSSKLFRINLDRIENGTYSALIVGHYISITESENINDTVMLLGNIDAFNIPLKHHRGINVIKRNRASGLPLMIDRNNRFQRANGDPVANIPAKAKKMTDHSKSNGHLLAREPSGRNENPDLPKVNKSVKKPQSAATENYRYYVVRPGDWLSKIAQKFYGSHKKYMAIFEANRDIVNNPDLIYPGQKLKIPMTENIPDYLTAHSED